MGIHRVEYRLEIPDGQGERFVLEFDETDFSLLLPDDLERPDWARLEHHKCDHCPLEPTESSHCPLALGLVPVVEANRNLVSHTRLEATAVLPSRTVSRETDAQDALRSLMGLIIPASGCPHTVFFRPMARFHLPFSDEEETLYRVASMYRLAQNLRRSKGLESDPGYDGLVEIYRRMKVVNRHVVDRLRDACDKDSSLNAVVILDVFAQLLPLQFGRDLDEFLTCFGAYL